MDGRRCEETWWRDRMSVSRAFPGTRSRNLSCVFYRKILKTGERQLLFCYEEVFTVESSGFVWWRKAAGWCQISKRRQHEGEKSVFGSHVLLLHLHLQIDADQVGVGSSVNGFFKFLVQPAIVFVIFVYLKGWNSLKCLFIYVTYVHVYWYL